MKLFVKKINRVYETRSAKKKAGCPTQLIYKLFMNSAYGKTIMKAGNTRTIYRAKDEIEDYGLSIAISEGKTGEYIDTETFLSELRDGDQD